MKLGLIIFAVLAALTIATLTIASEHKLQICHVDGYSEHTIEIDKHALPAHLEHGDTSEPCIEPNAETTLPPVGGLKNFRIIHGG